jgi:hypothetical protein
VRTLILILICAAFVAGGVLDARAERKGHHHMVRSGVTALGLGIFVCWLLVYVVGIFDNWQYSLRR